MARRHGGLGRGLDALIPMREEVEKAMRSAESEGVEILFADEEETESISAETPLNTPSIKNESIKNDSVENEQNVSRETLEKTPDRIVIEPAGQSISTEGPVNTVPAAIDQMQNGSDGSDGSDQKDSVTVRISEVEPNRDQPRKHFDEEKLEELAESIKTYGMLQPILVQKKDGYYEIIAGERRWRAALKAGLKEIPVIIRDYSPGEILELSLIENIQRENLNPVEEAEAYKRLSDEFGLGQEEIAKRVSKSRSAVANSLRLLKLEEEVRKMLIGGQLSMGHARALLPLEIPEEQVAIAQKVVEKQQSVRETEKLVRDILKTGAKPHTEEKVPAQQEEDPSIAVIYKEIEERLQQTLHTKVQIQRKRNGHGKLLIDFYNSDDLDKIIDRLTDR